MRSDGTAIIIGHMGADADVSTTPNGKTVARIRVAINRRDGKGEKVVLWCNADVWNPKPELLAQLKKGAYVRVRGDLHPDEYTARDGTKISRFRLNSANVILLASPNEGAAGGGSAPIDPEIAASAADDVDDELPF